MASATIFEVEEYEVQGLTRRLERFLPSELEEDSYTTSAVVGTEDWLLLSASYGIVIRYLTGVPMGHQEDALFVLGLEGSDDVRPLYFLAEVILPCEVLERHRIAPVTELGLDPRSTSLVSFASWSADTECYLLSDVS